MIGVLEERHFQSERFKAKLYRSLAIVQSALRRNKRPYIAFSSGKDSVAVTALVHTIAPDVQLVWSDDELEYPETVSYMADLRIVAGPQLTIATSYTTHAGWFRAWTDKPFWRTPFEGSLVLKERNREWMARLGFDLTFTGLRMGESKKRAAHLLNRGYIYRVGGGKGAYTRCCPLWDWTADDVWALIAGWRLPYNGAYDVMDAAGISRERQRVGPLPLTPRSILVECWPDLLGGLEKRYGKRWF